MVLRQTCRMGKKNIMKNGILAIVIFISILGAGGIMAYRLGVSNCREDVATEAEKVQQVVQESDRNIRKKVLSTTHSDNLNWLVNNYKRAE